MKKKEDKDKEKTKNIKVSKKIQNFDIQINSFGEIISNYNVDNINEFLNKNVDDKKLRNREDLNNPKKDKDKDSPNKEEEES